MKSSCSPMLGQYKEIMYATILRYDDFSAHGKIVRHGHVERFAKMMALRARILDGKIYIILKSLGCLHATGKNLSALLGSPGKRALHSL
jgi:hypothetical protein